MLSPMPLQTPLTTLEFAAEVLTCGIAALAMALCFRNQAAASRWLGGFFACLGLSTTASAVTIGWASWLPETATLALAIVNVTPAYLAGLLLYAHVAALLADGEGRSWRMAPWHLLPAALVAVYLVARLAFPDFAASSIGLRLVSHAWAVIGVPYLAMAAWRLREARCRAEDLCADETSLRLGWLRHIVMVVAVLWLVSGVERISTAFDRSVWEFAAVTVDLVAMASVFLLAWSGLRAGILLPRRAALEAKAEAARYARSGLGGSDLAQVAADLSRRMREARLYADETLDLRALSERSGWSPSYISQALNQQLGRNFFEFVNGFRVEAAKACLADDTDRRTALEIGLACGFGSKSTFNAVFKRMTGMTPSAFRRGANREALAESAA